MPVFLFFLHNVTVVFYENYCAARNVPSDAQGLTATWCFPSRSHSLLHSCPVGNVRCKWTSCKYCSTTRKHLLQFVCVTGLNQPSEHVNSSSSLLFNPQTAPTGFNHRNECSMSSSSSLLLPLICTTTASACCPMIHSCWIIDALFIDLWRASSVRLSLAALSSSTQLSVVSFFISTASPLHLSSPSII